MRTRREFIGGRAGAAEQHIASVLVHVRPERLAAVEADLTRLPGVESHGAGGAGRLILTIETTGDTDLMERITRIETADGVLAASLVYHHAEELADGR